MSKNTISLHSNCKTFFNMRGLEHFSLQIKSLKNGSHNLDYQLDTQFFSLMKSELIQKAQIQIKIDLTRENKNMDIHIDAQGHYSTACDRCTAQINMPVTFESTVYVQINDYPDDDDLETYYLTEKETVFDLAPIIYNEVCLHKPIINIYDCEEDEVLPCDTDTLDRIEYGDDDQDASDDEKQSPWDTLKNLDL